MTIRDAILGYLNGGSGDPATLALDLFNEQRRSNPLYAAITQGADPQSVWEIPAVPVTLFKRLSLRSFQTAPSHVFLTSGTTGQERGTHALADDEVYNASAWAGFARHSGTLPALTLSLCPTSAESSLAHMIAYFARRRRGELIAGWSPETGVGDVWPSLNAPLFVPATAFALDQLLATAGQGQLDAESLVMVTGGFKGRRVRLDSESLYRSLTRLGSPRVLAEYGMTELCSQLWSEPVPAGAVPPMFYAPPWLRVYTVDPITGAPAATGLLRFVDLANTDSVVAIETMDVGRVEPHPDGDRVWLHGRAEGAELRGCSLRAEDLGRAVAEHG